VAAKLAAAEVLGLENKAKTRQVAHGNPSMGPFLHEGLTD